jgi:hypothetical protein
MTEPQSGNQSAKDAKNANEENEMIARRRPPGRARQAGNSSFLFAFFAD